MPNAARVVAFVHCFQKKTGHCSAWARNIYLFLGKENWDDLPMYISLPRMHASPTWNTMLCHSRSSCSLIVCGGSTCSIVSTIDWKIQSFYAVRGTIMAVSANPFSRIIAIASVKPQASMSVVHVLGFKNKRWWLLSRFTEKFAVRCFHWRKGHLLPTSSFQIESAKQTEPPCKKPRRIMSRLQWTVYRSRREVLLYF